MIVSLLTKTVVSSENKVTVKLPRQWMKRKQHDLFLLQVILALQCEKGSQSPLGCRNTVCFAKTPLLARLLTRQTSIRAAGSQQFASWLVFDPQSRPALSNPPSTTRSWHISIAITSCNIDSYYIKFYFPSRTGFSWHNRHDMILKKAIETKKYYFNTNLIKTGSIYITTLRFVKSVQCQLKYNAISCP